MNQRFNDNKKAAQTGGFFMSCTKISSASEPKG